MLKHKAPAWLSVLLAVWGALLPATSRADDMLSGFSYPYEVKSFAFASQGQQLSMTYMDLAPKAAPNGRTVVLLHGKNFCAATWESVIAPLTASGYRVVAPDQVGFCKSSKPMGYQFGLHQLAANTNALLSSLGIERAIVMGHSMGGMLAMRYALQFSQATEGLVVVNPIGLEDWKAKGVPFATVDQLYERERKTTAEGIRKYQQATYYAGTWKPEYDRWVDMLAGMYAGSGGERFAWMQALTSDMIFSQPVVWELDRITVPALLLIGEKDNTAIGKDRAPAQVAAALGRYGELARETAARIPSARLITFADLGHSPHIQAPDRFNAALLDGLVELAARRH